MPALGILLLLLMSCTTISPEAENLNRVAYQTAKRIEKRMPLICTDIGASIPEKIESVTITFDYNVPFTITEGRKIILSSINIALETFQNDLSIQKYLKTKPFGINNVDIFLYSEPYAFKETPTELLSSVYFMNGVIAYRRFNSQNNELENILKETYEEALQKCQ